MLNRAPIFINGFSFGGTNLLMNLLASHPDVCMLSGETHEIFYSKPHNSIIDKLMRKTAAFPIRASVNQHVFGKWCYDERWPLSNPIMRYIDLLFYLDKITTDRNHYKSEGVRYTFSEVRRSRFLAKNMNGVVFASGQLSVIYPDATFIAIVRDGLPLCEGYVRRGWKSADVGRMYEKVCQKIITDSQTLNRYHIVRFEDMVSDPLSFMEKIYSLADLDIQAVPKVRLQAKRSMDKDGTRKYTFGGSKDRETHWFDIDELDKFVRKDVNANQADQLSVEDRETFFREASKSLEFLGYQKTLI